MPDPALTACGLTMAALRGEMALDVVREYVASQRAAIYPPPLLDETRPPLSGWIGRTVKVDGHETVALLPQRLKEALSRAGYDLEAVLPAWRESQVLVENPSYRPPYLIKKKIEGRPARMYIFSPEVFASDDEDGE